MRVANTEQPAPAAEPEAPVPTGADAQDDTQETVAPTASEDTAAKPGQSTDENPQASTES